MNVDVSRYRSPHRSTNRLARLLWMLVETILFHPSPRWLFFWRRFILRVFGARIGRGVFVYPSARIWAPWNLAMADFSCLASDVDCYCVDRIEIGAHVTVSQYAFLCAAGHDIEDPSMALKTAPIRIGDGAWIAAGAYVGPGVTVGEGAVAAARAVVVHDVEPWTVVGGNPARPIKKRVLRSSS